ncbi:GGDEF domain-containing protein [Tardiphaga alba]|uniref:diguanylate cyclase n=1 Tax=Tardiphaga alba TaxID=340268 RepID=A0ABX8AB68_9BRAD|nr:GGDEF domain-containing protein [Tardiphaga alba]QUS40477.1 GGDEF domain-containing protein [Tardiphaga alba]
MQPAASVRAISGRSDAGEDARRELARRAAQRRPAYVAQAASYGLDAALLLLYHFAGVVSATASGLYLAAGLIVTGIALYASELHLNDRFRDHYLTVPLCVSSITIQLFAIYLAPQVGIYFILLIFVVLGFGALRMSARQTALVWTFATLGLAALFLMTDRTITLPVGSTTERLLAVAVFVTALGRCASTGLYGSSMREMLYRRSNDLREANARIEELAQLDELTGAFNRRYIMKCLNDEIAKVQQQGTICSVAIIDLDHFKRINDRYGHPVGDEVLRSFAISIFANIRMVDKLGRYGGEEFLLVLPDNTVEQSLQIVERLRGIIADLDWASVAPDLSLTMSAGISGIAPNDTAEDVLARADRALYSAKDAGRNRVLAVPQRRRFI